MFKVWCGFLVVAAALLMGGQAVLGSSRSQTSSGGLQVLAPGKVTVTPLGSSGGG